MLNQLGLQGAIREAVDPLLVMRRVVTEALRLVVRAEGAVVELVDGDKLTYVCCSGTLAEHVGVQLPLSDSLSGLAVRRGEVLRCDDAASDDRVNREVCVRVGAISMVCVPLRRRGVPVGVLKVSASTASVFTDADVESLTRLADFVTETIASAESLARLTADLADTSDDGCPVREAGISQFVANVLEPGILATVECRQRIEATLAERAFTTVYQPVVHLPSGEVAGCEALTRFQGAASPDVWFAEAHRVGLGVALELAAVEAALPGIEHLPEGMYVAVNAGPGMVSSTALRRLLERVDAGRVVVELTEHTHIDDYDDLRRSLGVLRSLGARVAIDDTGAGFASFAHILKLAPDLIKLDRILTTGIDLDPVRRAMAAALVGFATETGARVIAEGIETYSELCTVRDLGIEFGQGYFLGRPGPLSAVRATSTSA